MSSTLENKPHHKRSDYKPCRLKCIICEKNEKQGSKWLSSCFALKYHLETVHDREDEIKADITSEEILQTVKAIAKALDWNMFIDLPIKEIRF